MQLHPAIDLAAGIVRVRKVLQPIALGGQAIRVDSLLDQEGLDGLGPLLGQKLVALGRADDVRVAGDFEVQRRERPLLQGAGDEPAPLVLC